MRPGLIPRRALVFGGTGAVGREVLQGLSSAGIPTTFTYLHSVELAGQLAADPSRQAIRVDLADLDAVRACVRELAQRDEETTTFFHCAAENHERALHEITRAEWQRILDVNAGSAFVACQELSTRWIAAGRGDAVLVGALDRTQSMPAPIHFAASQGMLSSMTMALARELGHHGVRVNMVALGLLRAGLSETMSEGLRADFQRFSALQRIGTPAEVSRVILWLALENSYMSGKVLTVNGGV